MSAGSAVLCLTRPPLYIGCIKFQSNQPTNGDMDNQLWASNELPKKPYTRFGVYIQGTGRKIME